MTLEELAAWEDRLLAAIPEHGYLEERSPRVPAGLAESWHRTFAAYVGRIGPGEEGQEGLRRAVFLTGCELDEPWPAT